MRSVAIFAFNEEAAIGGAIEAVRAAGLNPDDRVVVLVNGSTDGTLAVARAAAGTDPRVRVVDIQLGDKANAWSLYVRQLADTTAEVHVFVDGDIRISRGSLALIDAALGAHPEASAASGLPRGGRRAPAWAARILENHGMPGNFYALRGALVQRMRDCLWLPVGLVHEDRLLRWLVLRDLDPRASPRLDQIRPVPGAWFDYTSFSQVSVAGLRRLWRRHLRYALGDVQASTLWHRLEADGLAAMPHRIDALYAEARAWHEIRAGTGPVPLRRLLFPLMLARARHGASAPLPAPSWWETASEPRLAATGGMTVPVEVSPMLPGRRGEAPSVPDFVVIGAMKAGTTTLYQHLAAHPEVGMSATKETDFFVEERNFALGYNWYRSQFQSGFRLYGEVSPNYAKHDIFPGVPARLAKAAPEARIIFIARDPVERTLSHYAHSWLLGHMCVSPEDLLASPNGTHMLETSRYAAQIEIWLRSFPRDRFLFLDFEALAREPQAVTDRIFDFLGLRRMPVDDRRANDAGEIGRIPAIAQRLWRTRAMRRLDPLITRGMRERARRALVRGKPRQSPPVSDAVRAEIAARLAEDAERFRRITGMEFARWSI